MKCYYSPTGGRVQALLEEASPELEYQVMRGRLASCDVPDSHALCAHVRDSQQPTVLDGWHGNGHGLEFRQQGFVASSAAPAGYTAAQAEAAALRQEVRELRELLTQLALPTRKPKAEG